MQIGNHMGSHIFGMIILIISLIIMFVLYWISSNAKRRKHAGEITPEEARKIQIRCLIGMVICLVINTIYGQIRF